MPLQDIRHMMPQQDPNKIKPYVHEEYPKQLTFTEGGKTKPHKRKDGYLVIVLNEAEEKEFLRDLKAGEADTQAPETKAAIVEDAPAKPKNKLKDK